MKKKAADVYASTVWGDKCSLSRAAAQSTEWLLETKKNLLPNYYFSIRISKTDEAISDFSKEIIIRFFYRRKSPLQLFYFFTTVGC